MAERMLSRTSPVRMVAQSKFHVLSATPVTESDAFCITKKDTHVYYNQIAGAAAPATAATAATTTAAASATAGAWFCL